MKRIKGARKITVEIDRKTIAYFLLIVLTWSALVLWSGQEILMAVVERAAKRAVAERCSGFGETIRSSSEPPLPVERTGEVRGFGAGALAAGKTTATAAFPMA